MAAVRKIGIISGSIRPVQAGSQITDYIQAVIKKHLGSSSDVELTRINIKDLDLPLSKEPGMPQPITYTDGYTEESTKAWSKLVSPLDGFVVVTPEYNCAVPAGLKNAIDMLWHEWTGKPFFIVSYGIKGATFAYEDVKRGLTMAIKAKVVETPVNLAFGEMDNGIMFKAASGADLELSADKDDSLWADRRGDITKGWDELIALLNEKKE